MIMISSIKMVEQFNIEIGDKSGVKAIGRGSVHLVLSVNGKPRKAVIENVAYAPPTMAYNILSVRVMNRDGKRTEFEEDRCVVGKCGKVMAEGDMLKGLSIASKRVGSQQATRGRPFW
jgi:hypothetical protein